jgi:tetratricopeptide (TPR) repeat protein
MSEPRRSDLEASTELANFTDREDHRKVFYRHLNDATKPPVLMFFGVGGAGKTWLLKKVREEVPLGLPTAFIDFDVRRGGDRFSGDFAQALYEIRQQLGQPTPRFDLAYAMRLFKQGVSAEPEFRGHGTLGTAVDFAAEIVSAAHPGAGSILNKLGKHSLKLIRGTPFEQLLATNSDNNFLLTLRRLTTQQIEQHLIGYLCSDLDESLKPSLSRAVRAVLFFDAFEAPAAGFREEWVQDVAGKFGFALTVISGQNRLTWSEGWEDAHNLEQHLVGGLSEHDARRFLEKSEIANPALQNAILSTATDLEDNGKHCFSLALCVDIVRAERRQPGGRDPNPESLRFRPQDWKALALRFLKSLDSKAKRRWIFRLAITPRFDEQAARAAFSEYRSVEQDQVWEDLQDYSFLQSIAGRDGWYGIRSQMSWALENQPSEQAAVKAQHTWWRAQWESRSKTRVDDYASLAWYHHYALEPTVARQHWQDLAKAARTSVPPRMVEHFRLTKWWDPTPLLDECPVSAELAAAAGPLGHELERSSLGNRSANLEKAIAGYEAALRVYTEADFPQDWAITQNNLGIVWSDLPTGNRSTNLEKALACYEAALRVRTEADFPRDWAATQINLGNAWSFLPKGDRSASLERTIACYKAALRIHTEADFPQEWATTQNNLGAAWSDLPTGDRSANLEKAIACYEAALRVHTEADFPREWAGTVNNLGNVWSNLPMGDRSANLERAIACYEAAERVYTEADFPQDWAGTQNNLGAAWKDLPTGDRSANLEKAIACYEAALRIHTEADFPWDWAGTLNNLGNAWSAMPMGDRFANLKRAIAYFEAALRVYTEADFPQEWAMTQYNLGIVWGNLSAGDRSANLERAIACYEAAERVYTEANFPRDWAKTQINLGKAWGSLAKGDRSANLEKAIACYEAALRVRTEADFPQDWAKTQINLGNAWSDLPMGDRSANLERAIAYYEAALRVYSEADFPQDWAMTQYNLGIVWSDLSTGDRSANLERAIAYYEAAERVYTEADFPQDWAKTQNNLGVVWSNLPTGDRSANLQKALACYETAARVYTEADFPSEHRMVLNNGLRAFIELA